MKIDKIVEAARIAHRRYWRATSDESTGDKQASRVTRAWQDSVVSTNVEREVPAGEGLRERIDIVDFSTGTAYELKVSGKNPHHEFYKDIFKILTYNHHHGTGLARLIFITEKNGVASLEKGLGKAVVESMAQYNLDVTLEPI